MTVTDLNPEAPEQWNDGCPFCGGEILSRDVVHWDNWLDTHYLNKSYECAVCGATAEGTSTLTGNWTMPKEQSRGHLNSAIRILNNAIRHIGHVQGHGLLLDAIKYLRGEALTTSGIYADHFFHDNLISLWHERYREAAHLRRASGGTNSWQRQKAGEKEWCPHEASHD